MAARHNFHVPGPKSPARIPDIYKSAAPGPAKLLEPPFQLLVKAFQEFVILLDAEGTVLAVSTVNETISERARHALLGHGLRDFVGEKGFAPLAEIFRRVLATNHREERECRVEMRDGPHWFEVRVKPAFRRRRDARTLCLLVQDITLQKEAQDEERRRIAIELHDSTAQNLVALRMNLSRIKSAAALSDSLREMLDSSIESADASLQEVRTLSYLLHPPLVEEAGLAAALRGYAAGFAERSGMQVEVEIAEDLARLRRDVETAVFRIVQEALVNAHRHSGSPAMRIGLARSDGNLELDISDRGSGMPPPGPPGEGGLWPRLGVGLAAMRERVKHLDGTLEISSAPGEGTTIHVRLPFAETP